MAFDDWESVFTVATGCHMLIAAFSHIASFLLQQFVISLVEDCMCVCGAGEEGVYNDSCVLKNRQGFGISQWPA